MKILYYDDAAELCIENINLSNLCKQFSTPFYVYSKSDLKKNCRDVIDCGRGYDFSACYALKANFNPELLSVVKKMGFGADVVSGGELYFAQKRGISADKIVFAGVGKTAAEIEYAIKSNIHSINIESEGELNLINEIAFRLKQNVRVAVRVNPDIDPQTHPYISTGLHTNKFGVPKGQAIELFRKTLRMEHVSAEGLHVHIGSQITSSDPYIEAAIFLANMVEELRMIGIQISFLDLGGGIGINYDNQLSDDNNERTYIKLILPEILKELSKLKIKIVVELGRSIIGSAGLLITKVINIKENQNKKFVIVDAAMNNLIRPSLYQAHHQILPLKDAKEYSKEKVDVVGPVCETGDFFAKDRELQKLEPGDYLAITAAGAYGQSLSSNYNLRPSIAEIIVDKDEIQIIKEEESIEDFANKFDWNKNGA